MKSFNKYSYQRHAEHFKKYAKDGDDHVKAKSWLNNDTVDAWRHERMYALLDPILNADSGTSWLTVGDGRYGKDSRYISERGCTALPTDISEYLLREAKDMGYIKDYCVENAESLTFTDEEFDYILCKESFHHFPRPYMALYEMLRVSKKGVILIEPHDIFLAHNIISQIIQRIKKLLGKPANYHSFEDSGNYVYSISQREIEKVALGLNYSCVAFAGINDAYIKGAEEEKIHQNGPIWKRIKRKLFCSNILCALNFKEKELLAAIIFKNTPDPELRKSLKNSGYNIVDLPKNPYV